MTSSFYWYDLETSGTDPKWDRMVQVAGLRTDEDLNVIGDELCTYVRLGEDVLPNPEACLVTGIMPETLQREGIPEVQAWEEITRRFTVPETCVVGYNSLRFDDEFVRYGLYRHLFDPYAREWQNGCSRWDILDLVRAAGGLRRDGIHWPQNEDGLPVYKLEELTKANGIGHSNAHDALADVHATIAMARLIKQQQPKLFDYYFALRNKRAVREVLEPYGSQLLVHVSGIYPRERFGVAPVVSLTRHPTNTNSVIVVDLAQDITSLLEQSEHEIRNQLFTSGQRDRPPLKEIKINRCPFIAPIDVLDDENIQRLQLNMRDIKERARRLKQPGLMQKIRRVYTQPKQQPADDVDAALYQGFLQDEDRSRCLHFHASRRQGDWPEMDFSDPRLMPLVQRMKARSHPDLLDSKEQGQWEEFVARKLHGEGDWLNLQQFHARLDELSATLEAAGETLKLGHMQQLREYGRALNERYPESLGA